MAQDLFRVEAGFADGNVEYLSGAGVPAGNTGRTLAAPVGSFYTDTATGLTYKKVENNGVAADWSKNLTNADFDSLNAAIAAEVTRAQGAESTLQSAISAEATRAQGAESTLQSAISAEVTRAQGAESTLQSAISAEVTRAQGAESTLQSAISAEVTRAQGAESTLQSAISAEVTRATGAESALDARVTEIEGSYVKSDGSVAFTGDQSMGGNKLTNVATPAADGDAVNKVYVDQKIAKLGNAFNYVGTVAGGTDAASALDLSTLPADGRDSGDYYKVTTEGYFKASAEATPFFAHLNDGIVANLENGWDVIAHADTVVAGTANYISVTGTIDTGFTVDVDSNFKSRVSTLETGLAAEVTRAQAAESGIANGLIAETTRATGAEATLQSNIDAEAAARAASDATLTTNLAAEVTRAQAAETILQSNIDAEATDRSEADSTLQGAIDDEAAARASADLSLSNAISDEVTRASDAETEIRGEISTEQDARAAGDAALQTALTAETNRANAAEGALQGAISDEVARAQAAEASISTSLAAEVTRASNAESALQTALLKARTEVSATNVTTSTAVDSVNGAAVGAVKWIVRISGNKSDTGKFSSFEIFSVNNSDGSTVTDVAYTIYAKLNIGTIAGLDVSVMLTGENVTLMVASTNGVNVKAVREVVDAYAMI